METDQTEDEVRAQRKKAMGADLGELHFLLWKQLTALSIKWKEYKTLFASSKEDVDVLNAVAPSFFWHSQRALWLDTLLHICRLTDPAQSMGKKGKENLSVRGLPPLIHNPAVRGVVERLVADAKAKTNFARDWRNRAYAHSDLKTAKNPKLHALAKADRKRVDEALSSIGAVLNAVEESFGEPPTLYDHAIEPLGGAAVLLRRLRAYVTWRQRQRS